MLGTATWPGIHCSHAIECFRPTCPTHSDGRTLGWGGGVTAGVATSAPAGRTACRSPPSRRAATRAPTRVGRRRGRAPRSRREPTRHLDGPGDQLVEAGVEQAQPITALLGERRQPLGGRQLGLQRLDRRRLRHRWRRRRRLPARRARRRRRVVSIWPRARDDLVATLGDPPRFVDAFVEAGRQRRPSAVAAGRRRLTRRLVEAALGVLGALGVAAPRLAEGVRLRRRRDSFRRRRAPARPTPARRPGGGDRAAHRRGSPRPPRRRRAGSRPATSIALRLTPSV